MSLAVSVTCTVIAKNSMISFKWKVFAVSSAQLFMTPVFAFYCNREVKKNRKFKAETIKRLMITQLTLFAVIR